MAVQAAALSLASIHGVSEGAAMPKFLLAAPAGLGVSMWIWEDWKWQKVDLIV